MSDLSSGQLRRRYSIRISGPHGMILSRLLYAVREAAEAQLAQEHPAPELAIIQVEPMQEGGGE